MGNLIQPLATAGGTGAGLFLGGPGGALGGAQLGSTLGGAAGQVAAPQGGMQPMQPPQAQPPNHGGGTLAPPPTTPPQLQPLGSVGPQGAPGSNASFADLLKLVTSMRNG
jgi:hypothetical protein